MLPEDPKLEQLQAVDCYVAMVVQRYGANYREKISEWLEESFQQGDLKKSILLMEMENYAEAFERGKKELPCLN